MGLFTKPKTNTDIDMNNIPKEYLFQHRNVLDKVTCSFGEVLIYTPLASDLLICGQNRPDLAFRMASICSMTPYREFLKWDLNDAMQVVDILAKYLRQCNQLSDPKST